VNQPILDLFTELAALPSPPGEERAVADAVARYLRDLALDVEEDDAGAAVGSTIGNLLCRLEPHGVNGGGVPLFLCAHLDTVPPEGPIEPEVEDGVVRNAAGTILGADNKAAVAVMLEAARRVLVEGRPHAGLELLFTPKEEVGLLGAAAFDHTRLRASVGYVYDQAAPIGEVILGAPHAHAMNVRFHGRAAHSGMYPEEGRSAIAAAARAIADFRLGRLDEETTANVGTIAGGSGINVVPERCRVEAEVRSLDEAKVEAVASELVDHLTDGANTAECDLDVNVSRLFHGSRTRPTAPQVQVAEAALRACGYTPRHIVTGGGSDANALELAGFPCTNLANGTERNHQPDEAVSVAALEGMLDVTFALLDHAPDDERHFASA
jgi:tripeptide aminopeptidase